MADQFFTFLSMLALSHALTGAVIAAKTTNPILGYSLAIVSHPLLDLFPHWDFNTRCTEDRKVSTTIIVSLTDAAIGFAIGFILYSAQVAPPQLLLTMFLAQLPDWLEAPYHVFNWKFPPFTWVKKFQHILHWKMQAPWGILTQLAYLVLILSF